MSNQAGPNENVLKMLKALTDDLGKNFDKEKQMKSTFSTVRSGDDLLIEKKTNIDLESISVERLTKSVIDLASKEDFAEIAIGSIRQEFVKNLFVKDNMRKISELLGDENLGASYALSIMKTVSSLGIDQTEEILSLTAFLPFVVTLLNNFKDLDNVPSRVISEIMKEMEEEKRNK